ncbi:MAG: fumarylacetoacetate hydrolase family protein [Anaerolineales bacterium]
MRIVRYETQDGKKPKYGWLLGDKVGEIGGNIYGRYRRQEALTPLSDVRLIQPCEPGKIICVGRNYVEHAKELGNEVPKVPLIFMKPPSSVIPNGETILLPPQSNQIEHEAELVAVIGKRGRHIAAEDAKKHILGYTIGNDVTARDLQKSDNQWTRAKGFDTFCPFGRGLIPTSTHPIRSSPAASTGRCGRWHPRAIWSSTWERWSPTFPP